MPNKGMWLKPAIYLALSFMIVGCAAKKELEYNSSYKNAIEFSQAIVPALSGGLDKQVSKMHEHIEQKNGLTYFATTLFPRYGSSSVTTSMRNFCVGVGGSFIKWIYGNFQWLCVKPDMEGAYFSYNYRVLKVIQGTSKILFKVVALDDGKPSNFLIEQAKQAKALEDKKTALRKADVIRRLKEIAAEHERKVNLSNLTRRKVMTVGSRICAVDGNLVTYTEKVSAGKIQYLEPFHKNMTWGWPKDFYYCDHK